MLLHQDNWHLGYGQILQDCRPSFDAQSFSNRGGTVLILCHPDADALCAARILSYALRADKIPYQLRPCGGYARLLEIVQSLHLNGSSSEGEDIISAQEYDADDQEDGEGLKFDAGDAMGGGRNGNGTIRAIVLLNLGATRNLVKSLFTPRPIYESDTDPDSPQLGSRQSLLSVHQTKVYVLDSHRPYHLANVHADKNIVLWNDFEHWHHNEGGIPSDGDGLSGDDESESDSDEDDDDDQGDSDSEESDDGEAEFEDEMEEDQVGEKRSSPTAISKRGKRSRSESVPGTPSTHSLSDGNDGDMEDSEDDDEDKDNDKEISPFTPNQSQLNELKQQPQQEQEEPTTILSIREQHQNRRNRIRLYYHSGTFYSSPVAFMAYTLLSKQLRHENVGDLLWLACIGVTDAYLHNRLDLFGYIQLAVDLENHVERVYPDMNLDDENQLLVTRSANAFYAEDVLDASSNANGNAPRTRVGFSENGRIVTHKNEFRFFLLRHSSLWESIRLSPDASTKMGLWKPSGIQKLQEMLAKMGLPLTQCRQPYAFMKPSFKRRLREMLLDHAEEYDLTNLSYTGFIRVTGYKSTISASDMSHAITALLECETKATQSNPQEREDENEDLSSPSVEELEEQALMSSFNIAYDALNSNGSSSVEGGASVIHGEGSDMSNLVNGGKVTGNTGLGAGIRLAMAMQRAIITTATSLVERNAICRLSHFRYAYLHATSQGVNGGSNFSNQTSGNKLRESGQQMTHHIFAKPLALTRLAHFLMDMHRSDNKWSGTRARPLVLLSEKPETQTYLVAGYEYAEERGVTEKNTFGQKFELATKTMQGRFKFDAFDSNVVEVKSSDVQKFIEHLHYMIDSI